MVLLQLLFISLVGEVEHRSLTRAELDICQAAARRGGARYETLSSGLVNYLYRRGLVWFDVPVFSDDHLSIPPLEGFVSNKSAPTGSEEVDPLETLMYQLFVAASDRVTVGKLASILNVSVDTLRVGISVACRLKFCIKLLAGSNPSSATSIPSLSPQVPSFIPKEDSVDSTRDALSSLDLDMVLGAGTDTPKDKSSPVGPALGLIEGAQSGGVALVVDSEVTGFLMMGALTPAVKKHSVTLFEGGRVYGSQVINELVEELRASVAMAAGFEGEMAALANTAAALAVVLDCVRDGAGGRPIELLRKESVANLAPDAAFRILSHSYNVVLPVAGLPNPPLPLSIARAGPTNYGPIPVATTPWMHLALYAAMGQAPKSLVIPAGTRLARVPVQLQGSPAALIWPWNVAAVRASTAEPLVVSASALLFIMNSLLSKTALLVQPIDVNEADYQHSVISLPLPLQLVPSNKGSTKPGTPTAAALPPSSSSASGAWATFEEGTGPNKSNRSTPRSPSGDNNNNSAAGARYVVGYMKDGVVEEVALPTEWSEALQKLGLGGAVGTLRLLRVLRGGISEWVPLCVLLGVPLQPLELCNAVCSSAAAAGFLESGACKRHEEGQHALSSALDAVTRQHGLQGPEANSVDVDLLAEVPLPLQMLQIDTRGKINRGDLGGAQQGVSLLHHR